MIPLNQVRIVNGPDDVFSFAPTAQITALRFEPGNLHLDYTKQGIWPPVGFETTTQEATFWVIAQIGGQWVAAGMERLRPSQHDKPEGADPNQWVANWVQGRNFGAFNGWTPGPAEHLGILVVAGNTRLGNGTTDLTVRERSTVVEVVNGAIVWTEGQAAAPAPSVPGPEPAPTPDPPPVSALIDALMRQTAAVDLLATGLAAVAADVATIKRIQAKGLGGSIPYLGTVTLLPKP